MRIEFTPVAWAHLQEWLGDDRKTFDRLLRLIEETCREPRGGLGKPERLKHLSDETWSKRITPRHRMVYEIRDDVITFTQLRGHYWFDG